MQWIEIILWLFLVEFIGFIGFPILAYVCKNLEDRGYGISKIFGIVLLTYLSYCFTELGIFSYGFLCILISLIFMLTTSSILIFTQRSSLLYSNGKFNSFINTVILTEIIFISSFFLFLFVLSYSPDINRGESRMDFAFINTIIRTRNFPPPYPWFSGTSLGSYYYYFGHLMVATITILSGIPSSITYNLALCLFMASLSCAAFCIGYNLTKKYFYGFLAVILIVFLANINGLLYVLASSFPNILLYVPGYDESIHDITKNFLDNLLSAKYSLFFWSVRIIPWSITEFPYYCFIWRDLHAHFISFPIILSFIVVLFSIFKSKEVGFGIFGSNLFEKLVRLSIVSIFMGFLFPQFIWNYPIFVIFISLCILVQHFTNSEYSNIRGVLEITSKAVFVIASIIFLSFIFYFPTFIELLSPNRGGLIPEIYKTSIYHFLILFTLQVFLIFSYLIHKIRNSSFYQKGKIFQIVGDLSIFAYFVIVFIVFLNFFERPKDFFSPLQVKLTLSSLLFDFQLLILLLPPLFFSILFLVKGRYQNSREEQFIFVLIVLSALIVLFSEFFTIYSRYIFIFKVYTSLWVFMGVISTYLIYYFIEVVPISKNKFIRILWYIIVTSLIFSSLVYVPISTIVETNFFRYSYSREIPTLDGTDYLRITNIADYEAIKWLNENIKDTEIILEVPGRSYTYTSRISSNTGLPTVLGWDDHVKTHLGVDPYDRFYDIDRIYDTRDNNEALMLISKYNVSYIYVGELEHDYRNIIVGTEPEYKVYHGLDKFDRFPEYYTLIYNKSNVQIYKVNLYNINTYLQNSGA